MTTNYSESCSLSTKGNDHQLLPYVRRKGYKRKLFRCSRGRTATDEKKACSSRCNRSSRSNCLRKKFRNRRINCKERKRKSRIISRKDAKAQRLSFRPKGEIFLRSLAFARDDGLRRHLASWRLGARNIRIRDSSNRNICASREHFHA